MSISLRQRCVRKIFKDYRSILCRCSSGSARERAFVEGVEVVFNTGGRGILIEKAKRGWWKVALQQQHGKATQFVKMRVSSFRLLSDLIENTHTVAEDTIVLHKQQQEFQQKQQMQQIEEVDVPFALKSIPAPARHAEMKSWIVFSDLHVKGSSIDICEEVLALVHEAALEKGAGVIFLGDFWHVRGALNVELLNKVLRSLRAWTQPVIMIPGNHDQVSLGGLVHALEPLVYAFRLDQVLLISEPSICLGALWIPYRRDPTLMQAILKAGADHPDVSIIFCHADVKGAYMNDGMRSREGIEISMFPPHLPIYSGHFHKPHTV